MKKEFVLLRFFIISIVWVASVLEVFLLPLIVGFFVALLFGPLVRWLQDRGVGRKLAVGIVVSLIIFIALLLPLGLLFFFSLFSDQLSALWPLLLEQFGSFQGWISEILGTSPGEYNWLESTIPEFLSVGSLEGSNMISFIMTLFSGALLAVIYSIFLIVFEKHILNAISTSFAVSASTLQSVVRGVQSTIGRFMGSMIVVIAILAVLYSIVLAIAGVPWFLLVGLLAALAAFVPTIGTSLGILLAVLVTAFSVDPLSAIIVFLVMISIQIIEEYYIFPRIMGNAIQLNMFAIILAIVGLGYLRGIIGIFLAVPLLSVMKSIARHYRKNSSVAKFVYRFLS